MAVAAWDDQGGVGVARVVSDDHGAELAVEVADSATGRGLGTILVRRVLAAAALVGVEEVVIYVHPENRAAMRLFSRMGARLRLEGGVVEGALVTAGGRERAA